MNGISDAGKRALESIWHRPAAAALIVVFAAILPVAATLSVIAFQQYGAIREAKQQELQGLAGALLVSVDAILKSNLAFVTAIAASETLVRGDFERFDAGSRRMLATQPQLESMAVTDLASGMNVVNTSVPLGTAVAAGEATLEQAAIVAQTLTPTIFGVRASGPTVMAPIVPIRAPIVRNGGATHVLTMALSPAHLSGLFAEAGYNPHWTGAVIDPNLNIVGRNRSPEQFVGRRITSALERALEQRSTGIFRSVNQEGQPVYTLFARSPATGWAVAVGVPAEEINGPVRNAVTITISFGLATILLIAVAVSYIARRIEAARRVERQAEAESRRLRIAAENAFHDSDTVKATILDSALDAIVTVDQRGGIIEWNNAATAIFGYDRDTVFGKPMADLIVPPGMRDAHRKAFARFVETGQGTILGKRLQMTAMRASGEEFPIEIAINAGRLGERTILSAYLRDVSEMKKTEEQLRQAQKMEAIGKLTGGMAHDFNNYLGVIIGNLDLLGAHVDAAGQALLTDALKGAESGAELTRSLLAFSRQQPLSPRRIDLERNLKALGALLRRTLGEDIALTVEVAPDAWPVRVDGALLDSCIVNLANNARDAMPRGGPLTISAGNVHVDETEARNYRDATPGDYVRIDVSDAGAGMAPETAALAFEPFFSTKPVGHGTGLGLSMVYGFVKQSGGWVHIDSAIGRGTAVRLYLPRDREADNAVVDESKVRTDLAEGGKETILLVEDNPMMRQTAVHQLTSLGYRLIEAENGEAALAILKQRDRRIDLLFTDMVMPGTMNGYELMRHALETRPGLRTLLTSGYPGEMLKDSRLAGVALLAKPYRLADLARAIREALDAAPGESRQS